MARKRKAKPATKPEPVADPQIIAQPPVAEAATDVHVDDPLTLEATSSPTTVTPWDEPIPPYPDVPPGPFSVTAADAPIGQLPVVHPPWDRRANQISAGKLIAKHLKMPPASAQLRAGQLSDGQIREIVANSLQPDIADLIRSVLADPHSSPCTPCA